MLAKSLTALRAGLDKGDFTSVELTQYFLQRIAKFNTTLNCYITVTEALALQQAQQADEKIQAKQAGSLTGIPIAHKDLFCTEGIKTSCGSKMLDNFAAPYNATVVEKIQAADMPMLGKCNMDEFAMGSSNENSFYGAVKNPWQTDCIPGGSSGGSAAAVAARLAPVASGTDTGGSIRQPAAMCGITGIKPSYGRVSRYGMIAYASSLDQGGVLANSAEDCALVLQAMAGFDERDTTSLQEAVPDFSADLNQSLKGLRIGLPKEFFGEGLDGNMQKLIQASLTDYEKLGAELVEVSLPNMHLAVPAYYVIAPAECSSNLSRFDGVRFGYRCDEPKDLLDLYKRSRSEAFGKEVQSRIMIGTYALSSGYYDAYYLKAQKVRRLIKEDFDQAFEQVDVIAGPTSPTTAFKIGEKVDDPVAMYLSDIYTVAVNLAGLPGLSHPAGFSKQLPVGLQLIGPYFAEAKLLNMAHQYQLNTDWHQQIPTDFAE